IVGGEVEAELPRLLDEGEILVGKRQDRDLGEVDLLVARQGEKEIERSLEPFHVDDQGRLAFGAIGHDIGGEGRMRHHETTTCVASRSCCMSAAKRARAAATAIASGCRGAASAAAARAAAAPPSSGASAATIRISSRRPLQWSTRSQPAATAWRERSAIVPLNAPMEMSSLINAPAKPITRRITSPIIIADVVAGAPGSRLVNTTCAVMASGRASSGRNARKSGA